METTVKHHMKKIGAFYDACTLGMCNKYFLIVYVDVDIFFLKY